MITHAHFLKLKFTNKYFINIISINQVIGQFSFKSRLNNKFMNSNFKSGERRHQLFLKKKLNIKCQHKQFLIKFDERRNIVYIFFNLND